MDDDLSHFHGGVLVIHHPNDADYAFEVREGLNRYGYQVWSRQRGAVYGDDVRDLERAAARAAFIVSIETELFREWHPAVSVFKNLATKPLVSRPKRLKIVDDNTYQSDTPNQIRMRSEIGDVVKDLHEKIIAISAKRYIKTAGKVVRSRRKYVFLSCRSADQDKAQEIRKALETAGMQCWSYIDSVRTGTGNEKEMMEVPEMIASAKAVVVVLTAKWLDSEDYCVKEFEIAAKLSRRCIWLRFENVDPPETHATPEVIDFGAPERHADGLQQLIKRLRRRRVSEDRH